MKILLHNLSIIAPLTRDACEDLSFVIKKEIYAAQEILISQNSTADKSWLFVDGMLRTFIHIDGIEATTGFTKAGASIINHTILNQKASASESIQALQSLTAWVLKKQDQLTLFQKHPSLEKLFLFLQWQQNNQRMADEHNLRDASILNRYTYLINKFPDILRYTTRHHLISYLKISKNTYYKLLGTPRT